MTYYVIKVDNREYKVRNTLFGFEIQTEDGWIHIQNFVEYLYKREKMNAILDLAEIGLDRLIGKK